MLPLFMTLPIVSEAERLTREQWDKKNGITFNTLTRWFESFPDGKEMVPGMTKSEKPQTKGFWQATDLISALEFEMSYAEHRFVKCIDGPVNPVTDYGRGDFGWSDMLKFLSEKHFDNELGWSAVRDVGDHKPEDRADCENFTIYTSIKNVPLGGDGFTFDPAKDDNYYDNRPGKPYYTALSPIIKQPNTYKHILLQLVNIHRLQPLKVIDISPVYPISYIKYYAPANLLYYGYVKDELEINCSSHDYVPFFSKTCHHPELGTVTQIYCFMRGDIL